MDPTHGLKEYGRQNWYGSSTGTEMWVKIMTITCNFRRDGNQEVSTRYEDTFRWILVS